MTGLLTLFISMVAILPALAAGEESGDSGDIAVGVSPSSYSIIAKEGQEMDLTFTVSRNKVNGPFPFEVQVRQETQFINIPSNEVTIASGSNSEPYSFNVSTTGLPLGDYTGLVSFLDSTARESEEILSIRYGIQGTVNVSVVPETEYQNSLQEGGLKLSNVFFERGSDTHGGQSLINYEIQNPGNVYIEELRHDVRVFDDEGRIVSQFSEVTPVHLAPFENTVFKTPFGKEGMGNYGVEVSVYYGEILLAQVREDLNVSKEVASAQPVSADEELVNFDLAFLLLGVILIISGLVVLLKKRKSNL